MKSNNQNLAIVSKVEDYFPDGLEQQVFISNYQANLWGIGLDIVSHPRGELPQRSILTNYTIGINLGQSHYMEQISDGHYEKFLLSTNSVGILPFQLPMWSAWDRDVNHLFLHLEPKLLSSHSKELFENEKVEIISSSMEDSLVRQIGLAIKQEVINHRNSSRLYVESMADALAVHLLHHYSTQTKAIKTHMGGLSPRKMKLVTEFINDNLGQEFSVKELAKLAKLSRYHFSRAFKQSMSITPHQYVIQQRVERAKQLLLQGKMTIADISMECGFTHQSHLNRHFKRLTGLTPKMLLKP